MITKSTEPMQCFPESNNSNQTSGGDPLFLIQREIKPALCSQFNLGVVHISSFLSKTVAMERHTAVNPLSGHINDYIYKHHHAFQCAPVTTVWGQAAVSPAEVVVGNPNPHSAVTHLLLTAAGHFLEQDGTSEEQ